MNDVSKIFPGFYIGSLPAVNRGNLDKHQITHILSILNEFRPKWTNMYSYLHIDIYDSPSVDIKKYFEKTFQFIEEGRREGAVLVHCFAGISRSATICIAYCMRKLRISFEDAHGLLFDARPIIFPNESFVKQLKKYEAELKEGIIVPISTNLRFKLYSPKYDSDDDESEEDEDDGYDTEEEYEDEEDEESEEEEEEEEEYDNVVKKDKKVNQKATVEQTTASISNISISSSSSSPSSENNDINNNSDNINNTQEETEEESNNNKATLGVYRYCCRKCSTELFLDYDILDHEQGEGQSSFKFHRRDLNLSENKEAAAKKVVCTSFFISEIEFVLNQTGEGMSGKLNCLNCKEKLGSWSWSGEQCSCGQWIAPSFQIPKQRIDEKRITKKN
ncbi:hypothetical protein DICPUDRAFT_153585 [Dictyostelium purpureum]|uniref:Uncharacterized protein n=1 Tax=Dictyostelium purpureum TaxID=5786 RepID=F0ZP93_DICPU|nr:uncharacterized protein DICPUDRAFT_153585 [Dictyostelium purpureum]EGC34235.1 hypothetical protein DICPUDRAFT_153585 [Dictyostelium purpureum]|eukprot:XP_003289245.1 hypothetical protein DICPUDRAFT_153585 [Dictyostelium purpureum]